MELKSFYNVPSMLTSLFNNQIELLPSVTELFELELAYLEYHCLNKNELLSRSAYLKSIDGKETQHFLMCNHHPRALTEDRSVATKSYFEDRQFSTGYATHGLFPYRGKFHPQLIKGLLNIIGVKKGETILDPMCGSGTANIEASLIGINSYAIDLSPFCQFMTGIKYESLTIKRDILNGISTKAEQLFDFFNVADVKRSLTKINDPEKLKVYNLALLAFLDALGYSKRVTTSGHKELFYKVLRRYEMTVFDFISNNSELLKEIGKVKVLETANAKNILLENASIDGIITSPPYSFAIDYIKNDEAQLKYLGYNTSELQKDMVGLRGKNTKEKLNSYFQDMEIICSEASRVLKKDRYFVMIIGSNSLVWKDKWMFDKDRADIKEWSDSRILKAIKTNEYFRKGIINIFFEGSTLPILSKALPLFELKKLSISKLNFDIEALIDTLIRYKEKGSYAGKKENNPETVIESMLDEMGVTFEKGDLSELIDNAPDTKRTMDFIIPNKRSPKVIIESSYLVTTSSGQGDKSKTEISIDSLIKEHYSEARFLGFVDGIGWYVRKNDLRRMVAAYEDVFTFHQEELERFKTKIEEVFNNNG